MIEKQIESQIGTAKSVKKLKNQTLLVETSRKAQTENLKKLDLFFSVPVEVTEHTTLNSSKGIIRNPILKQEIEESILDYLKPQGVTHVKRFRIKKNHEYINTNTLLLTFNSVTTPKSLKIFYQIIPVELYVPNPLRCFNYKSLVIMKATVLLKQVQFASDAEQKITITLRVIVEIQQSALTVAAITHQDLVTVMSEKRRKK